MFDVFCEEEKIRVLLSSQNILSINKTSSGLEIIYRCSCGHQGVWRAGQSN